MGMDVKGNMPKELRPEVGRVLSRWGDAGWGGQVADQKRAGRFTDDLANALAEMIAQRWKPDPFPEWITCVPSLKHPELVPDLARRVAAKLVLPFQQVITKRKDNEAQKFMQNRFHQCTNLDGAFGIAQPLPTGAVLLLDDVVDSGWTLSIISAQLRQAGSNLVYPVVLASTSHL